MMSLTNEYDVLAHDGELYLVMRKADKGKGENAPAYLYDSLAMKMSEPKPLQVWFKWGNFEEPDKTIEELMTSTEAAQ